MAAWQRWIWLGVVPIVAGALIAWCGSPRPDLFFVKSPVPTVKPAANTTPATSLDRLVGSASCSARGCHGALDPPSAALDPEKCLQNEYIRWTSDPHAGAYEVLKSERSQRISKLLGDGIPAHEDPRCLACHVNPHWSGASLERRPPHDEKLFGVGCESCHGSAGKWLVPHTGKSWRRLSPGEKSDLFGMVSVTDPQQVAQTCVGCHVGAPANEARGLPLRDVNHDLIAAGHPRLNFEFGSFLANLHPHWRPRPRSEAAAWAVGQYVSAQAALDLLGERARSGPWPEFAEYDCFSCHHSLAEPSWRQKSASDKNRSDRPLGSLVWGSWYYPLLRGSDDGLEKLARMMEKPMPERKQVEEQVRLTMGTLIKPPAGAAPEILHWLKDASARTRRDWDSAEQIYLGLYAVNLSQPNDAVTKLLRELTPIRAFAPGFDGPNSWPAGGRRAFHPNDFFDRLPWPQPKR